VMYSPGRMVLDNLLVDAVREAGAEIREATTFRELFWADGRVVGRTRWEYPVQGVVQPIEYRAVACVIESAEIR
jgi:flavin-dependent dehydrogenase